MFICENIESLIQFDINSNVYLFYVQLCLSLLYTAVFISFFSFVGELKQLLGVFDDLDKNLEGVKDNTLSWRQNLEDSANLWNVVSPGDDR